MTDIFTPKKKQQSLKRTTTRSVLNEQGELTASEETNEFKAISNTEPHFAKMYYQDRHRLNNISKNQILVYLELSFYSEYNTNQVLLNPTLKQKICTDLTIAKSTLDNALTELVKHQLIARIGKGAFILNPFHVGKGHWSENKKIRKNISYDIKHIKDDDENSPIKSITFNFDEIPNFIKSHAELGETEIIKPTPAKPNKTKTIPAVKAPSKTSFFTKLLNIVSGRKKDKTSKAYINIDKADNENSLTSAENPQSRLPH